MKYYNGVTVSKQKMLNTTIRPSDLSRLCQPSLIHSEECVFNLQMDTVELLSPPVLLSVKTQRKKNWSDNSPLADTCFPYTTRHALI